MEINTVSLILGLAGGYTLCKVVTAVSRKLRIRYIMRYLGFTVGYSVLGGIVERLLHR